MKLAWRVVAGGHVRGPYQTRKKAESVAERLRHEGNSGEVLVEKEPPLTSEAYWAGLRRGSLPKFARRGTPAYRAWLAGSREAWLAVSETGT